MDTAYPAIISMLQLRKQGTFALNLTNTLISHGGNHWARISPQHLKPAWVEHLLAG